MKKEKCSPHLHPWPFIRSKTKSKNNRREQAETGRQGNPGNSEVEHGRALAGSMYPGIACVGMDDKMCEIIPVTSGLHFRFLLLAPSGKQLIPSLVEEREIQKYRCLLMN